MHYANKKSKTPTKSISNSSQPNKTNLTQSVTPNPKPILKQNKQNFTMHPLQNSTTAMPNPNNHPNSTKSNVNINTHTPVNQQQPQENPQHLIFNKTTSDVFRQHCQSPALTTTYTNRYSNQIEQSLKIALELAQHHRKQVQQYKTKIQQLQNKDNQKINDLQLQIKELAQNNKKLSQQVGKYQQKYKKLKNKYKQLKQQRNNNQSTSLTNLTFSNPPNLQAQVPVAKISSNSNQNHSLNQSHTFTSNNNIFQSHNKNNSMQAQQIHIQLLTKTKTIHILCQQLYEYQQNSQNILRLISVLQQKIQELSMDNNLMRGVIRDRQISQQTQNFNNNYKNLNEQRRAGAGVFGHAGQSQAKYERTRVHFNKNQYQLSDDE